MTPPADPYGRDVLSAARPRTAPAEVPAVPGVVAEDPLSGFCGAFVTAPADASGRIVPG